MLRAMVTTGLTPDLRVRLPWGTAMNRSIACLFAFGAAIAATPALAHQHDDSPSPQGVYQGTWQGGSWTGQWLPAAPGGYPAPYQQPMPYQPMGYAPESGPDPRTQEMMARCADYRPDNGVGGALIGGLVGGVVGNRIASGNRAVGTVAGAAVGAVAGAVIDKAEDKGRERECQDFWRGYSPSYGAGYPGYGPAGYGYGYAPMGYMMVPVTMVQGPAKPCVETRTVTYEYVDVPRRRHIPARARPHDKRVKEKRVYTGS